MVVIHVKRRDQSQFLYETVASVNMDNVLGDLTAIYNGRLKIHRLCAEMEQLAKHGLCLPPNMQGLTKEQILELQLVDTWEEHCTPSGGNIECADPIGHRNGKAPNEKMADIIRKTVSEAKERISVKQAETGVSLRLDVINDTIDLLRGAMTIVYPMGLPPHETIRQELDGTRDLTGTEDGAEIINPSETELWWAGKQLVRGKKLQDFTGKNEKTKIIAKLQKSNQGAPAREPVMTEEQQREMMTLMYKRQEEVRMLEQSEDDTYLNSDWADRQSLRRAFQGVQNISWKPQ